MVRPEDANASELKDRLIGEFFDESHLAMWACDREMRVVLWNSGAEEIYGRTEEEMIGRPYYEEFVDEAEIEQSVEDCQKIIDWGRRFRNFLAYDHDPDGNVRYMLTNCFRIIDPVTGERYQAEVGVEISDLELRRHEHRTLRDLGIARHTEKRLAVGRERDELIFRIRRVRSEVEEAQRELGRELEIFRSSSGPRSRREVERLYSQYAASLEHESEKVFDELDRLRLRASAAEDTEALEDVGESLGRDPTIWIDRVRRVMEG